MTDCHYVGSELALFAEATRWKSYFGSQIQPYLGRETLEVGAGLGGTTRILCGARVQRWVCLEPDPQLTAQLQESILRKQLPACCHAVSGTLATLPKSELFDSILYIDVLEHIQDDGAEIQIAATHLRARGHLIVLSPAHSWLFSPFDQAIGHFRRYTKQSLLSLTPPLLRLERTRYLDSVGVLASLANRLLLRHAMPTKRQLAVWDKAMVPFSRVLDPVLGYRLGKSILAVWTRTGERAP